MVNTGRIKELLASTEAWGVLVGADGKSYIQDVTGVLIAGPVLPEHAELIARLRNYFSIHIQEVESSNSAINVP
jgi:hypothetical protein